MEEHKYLNERIAFLDLETTGFKAKTDKITQVAMIIVEGDQIIWEKADYCDPGIEVPPMITRITGITDEMLKGKPAPQVVLGEYLKKAKELKCSIAAGHNICVFDKKFIIEAIGKQRYDDVFNKEIDTLQMARNSKRFGSNKLGDVAKELGYEAEGYHDALVDVKATHAVYLRLQDIDKYLVSSKEISDAAKKGKKGTGSVSETLTGGKDLGDQTGGRTQKLSGEGMGEVPKQYKQTCIALRHQYDLESRENRIYMTLRNGSAYYYSVEKKKWKSRSWGEDVDSLVIQNELTRIANARLKVLNCVGGIGRFKGNFKHVDYNRIMKELEREKRN